MEAIIFGFLYLLSFLAGAIMCWLVMGRMEENEADYSDMPPEHIDMLPEMDEKLKRQYDNMFRYNGTERGQMSIE